MNISTPPSTAAGHDGQCGQATLALLVATLLVTMISVSLVNLMNTDLGHSSVQYAVSRSFYVAQAGLQEAMAAVFTANDPAADTTADAGITASYGGGQFTYWVDAGPASGGCGDGLKTLEAMGQVSALGRTIPTRLRACVVPGVPFVTALFGASRLEFQGASRTYLAPYGTGAPGGGGNLGSFTEINFPDQSARLNALSEDATDTVALRDGTFADYALFGFPIRPDYISTPTSDPTPWILSAFGDLVEARAVRETIPNRCGTSYACLTAGNRVTDIQTIGELRESDYMQHIYARGIRQEELPPLALDAASFAVAAAQNAANAALNKRAGLADKTDSLYTTLQFFQIVFYMASHPDQFLQGTVYIDGSFEFPQRVNLGGPAGNATLVVRGDLVIGGKVTITDRHDLSTVAGRRTPGIVVLGAAAPTQVPAERCGQRLNWSGRLVMCEGSTLVVDGLLYTQDGMTIQPGAFVDQVGAMYHNSRGTGNPSFTTRDATVVLRFDPLALTAFGKGAALLSWQQLH